MSTASARLYETDFYGWIQNQAGVLRAGNFAGLDLDNLIEEIEDVGKSRQRALESRLEILLMHLLKWQFQPDHMTPSWKHTIVEQRKRIAKLMKKNPSLSGVIDESFGDAYEFAVDSASTETGLPASTFPPRCPWTFEQATSPDFWPEQECTP